MSINFKIFAQGDSLFQNESIKEEILKFTEEHMRSIKNNISLKILREKFGLITDEEGLSTIEPLLYAIHNSAYEKAKKDLKADDKHSELMDSLNSTIEELKAIQKLNESKENVALHVNNLVNNHNNDIRYILAHIMNPSMDMDTLEKIAKRKFWHSEEILSQLDDFEPKDGLHYGLDEPYEGVIDDKFDDAYVEYKRQVDVVNNHNDYIEDMESLIKSLPMPIATREKLLSEVEDSKWKLPKEPNEQDYL